MSPNMRVRREKLLRAAEGYLALVMDASVGTRTGSLSEVLGN